MTTHSYSNDTLPELIYLAPYMIQGRRQTSFHLHYVFKLCFKLTRFFIIIFIVLIDTFMLRPVSAIAERIAQPPINLLFVIPCAINNLGIIVDIIISTVADPVFVCNATHTDRGRVVRRMEAA